MRGEVISIAVTILAKQVNSSLVEKKNDAGTYAATPIGIDDDPKSHVMGRNVSLPKTPMPVCICTQGRMARMH
jgi:hypothetical protein